MRPATWSNSKLRLLRICPHTFAEELRGVPRRPNPALEGGSSVHRGIAEIVRAVLRDDPIDVHAIARASCFGRPEELGDVLSVLTLFQEELAPEDGDPLFRPGQVIHIEERLSMDVTLSDGRTVVFDGMADVIEAERKTCTVLDWKTHFRPESQEAFEADPQLKRYALLVAKNHRGFDRYVIRKQFVRYRGARREMVLRAEDLAMVEWDLITEIEEAEARLASGDFPATPGDWCNLCAHTDSCPVVQNFLDHGIELVIDDDGRARRAAQVVRAIDAHSAQLKRRLKAYLGSDHPTGRVPLSGGSYGFGPSQKRRAATQDVVDVFEAFGRPINHQVLRVDVDQLERALNREPGAVRTAMRAAIDRYEIAECRYRRGDDAIEADPAEENAA